MMAATYAQQQQNRHHQQHRQGPPPRSRPPAAAVAAAAGVSAEIPLHVQDQGPVRIAPFTSFEASAAQLPSATMEAHPSMGMSGSGPLAPAPLAAAPSSIPTLSHISYFTAPQLDALYSRKRGSKMSASKWQSNSIMATGFIQSTASRLGFPQRTTATAQQLYLRFHLFYSPTEFVLHEVAIACLFVSAKLNDTNKKARDILLASYALRFPQLVKGGGSDTSSTSAAAGETMTEEHAFPTLAGQKRKGGPSQGSVQEVNLAPPVQPITQAIGSVSEGDVDPSILETDRKRLLALEKLILETLCFNFHPKSAVALKMVVKVGRMYNLPKSFIRTAWKVAADLHRTTAPLQYPPNVIAVASLYAAALLARPPQQNKPAEHPDNPSAEDSKDPIESFVHALRVAQRSFKPEASAVPDLEASAHVHIEDVEEAVHEVLDLYLACVSSLPPSLYMSTPSGQPNVGTATPSPHSPAEHLDMLTSSPSSSAGLSNDSSSMAQSGSSRRKLKQYEYAPPPFGLVDWLNSTRCSHLQDQVTNTTNSSNHKVVVSSPSQAPGPAAAPGRTPSASSVVAAQIAGHARQTNAAASADPTLPCKELSTLLTDLKIYLRGIEYDRQKSDDAFLADLSILAELDIKSSSVVVGDAAQPSTVDVSRVGIGMGIGSVATSLSIRLSTLTTSAHDREAVSPKPFQLSSLKPDQRRAVERIQRRKLVTGLRLTLIEPEMELKPTPEESIAPDASKQLRNGSIHQQHPPNQTSLAASAEQPMKKTRIEHATRFLF